MFDNMDYGPYEHRCFRLEESGPFQASDRSCVR